MSLWFTGEKNKLDKRDPVPIRVPDSFILASCSPSHFAWHRLGPAGGPCQVARGVPVCPWPWRAAQETWEGQLTVCQPPSLVPIGCAGAVTGLRKLQRMGRMGAPQQQRSHCRSPGRHQPHASPQSGPLPRAQHIPDTIWSKLDLASGCLSRDLGVKTISWKGNRPRCQLPPNGPQHLPLCPCASWQSRAHAC